MDKEVEKGISDYLRRLLISSKEGGDCCGYNDLLDRLRPLADNEESKELLVLMKVLTMNVSSIDERAHEAMLQQVLRVNLWMCSSQMGKYINDFALHLMSANGGCMVACMEMLVKSFVPPEARAKEPEVAARATEVHGIVLESLRRMLALAPVGSSALTPLLLRHMPHKRMPKHMHLTYLQCAFALAESPEGVVLREPLLLGVVDLLLQVDVEMRWEDIVLLEEEDEEEQVVITKMRKAQLASTNSLHVQDDSDVDQDELFHLDDHDATEPGGAHEPVRAPLPVDENADKLDSMMELVVGYINRREALGELHNVFSTLLCSFDHSLLHVHRSKFTQFLLFYACARDHVSLHNAGRFLDKLLEYVSEPTRPTNTRLSAIAYLASFLARAAFLPPPFVLKYLRAVCSLCVSLLSNVGHPHQHAGSALANVYSSLCQAALYVLCYRMRQLAASQHASQLRALPIRQILTHPLQPHARCLPSVVTEFLHHAAEFGVMDEALCANMLRHVNGTTDPSLPDGLGVSGVRHAPNQMSTGLRPLDSFFPFDPYLLRRSASQLELAHSYIRWGHNVTLAADNDDEVDGDADDDEEESNDRPGNGHIATRESSSESEADELDSAHRLALGSLSPGSTPIGRSGATSEAEDIRRAGFAMYSNQYAPAQGFAKPRSFVQGAPSVITSPHSPKSPQTSGRGSHGYSPDDGMSTTPLEVFTPMAVTPELSHVCVPFPLGKR